MSEKYINALINYGIEKKLIKDSDSIYIRNRILDTLGLFSYEYNTSIGENEPITLEEILEKLADIAITNKKIENTTNACEQLQNSLMNILTPRPSEIINIFNEKYKNSYENATDYFYSLCKSCDYIKTYRVARDIKWKVPTEYGELEITINLSKPEKDPRDIAAARLIPKTGNYPECLLCLENEGFSGTAHHPSRQNHRVIPINLLGEKWGMQYSPYLYYYEHCIVINKIHQPMKIDKDTFKKLIAFLDFLPHYFIGSNADLPIVGGSILSHEHFQGGKHVFTLENAEMEESFYSADFPNIEIGMVKWPMSVLRIRSADANMLVEFASHVLNTWRVYTDENVGIYAFSDNTPHNTITPIARMNKGKYEFDLVLRNNITSEEHPIGVFHPHKELHNIKKENIGLIEVMGLAILPPRLLKEIEGIKKAILNGGVDKIESIPDISAHTKWVKSWIDKYELNQENIDEVIKIEIGKTFLQVLSHAGVFKRDKKGKEAFMRFVNSIL